MSEQGPRKESSHELNAAARFLMDRMRAGDQIDPAVFGDLVQTLRAYQAGEYKQSVVRPAAFGSKGGAPSESPLRQAAMRPGPPPVPVRVPMVSREVPRRTSTAESFLEQEPWNQFRSKVARQELALLSEEERLFVRRAAEILREEMFAYRIISSKAIGANVRMYSHDYGGTDLLLPNDPQFSWDGWEAYFNRMLSSQEKAMVTSRPYEKNFVFATSAHGLSERNLAFMSVHFWAPGNTAPTDNRSISHEAAVFMKNARFMQLLKSGKGLRLLPFIIKTAAIDLKDAAVFFDGSFAGTDKAFGRAHNPIALCVQEPNQMSIFEDVDTRTNHPAQMLFSGPNTSEALKAALTARGRAESEDPAKFRLRPGASLPRDLPRLPVG